MQPFNRETVVDRRQPAIRWSAVLAGSAVAVGLWGVLQVLGLGAGLAALDPDDIGSARSAAVGTGAWSVIAPLIAMFAGGYVAAKLSNTFDRRVAGAHAAVMWGVTATVGLLFSLWMASHAAFAGAKVADESTPDTAQAGLVSDAHGDAREALVPINNRLRMAGKPQITPQQLVTAARGAVDDGELDQEDFVKGLAGQTALSKEEASTVATELGPRAAAIATKGSRATPAQHDAMQAAERAGKGLLAFGIAILLGIGTAILGAMLALRRFGKDDNDRRRTDVIDREREVHTTAPYPVTTPPTTTTPGV